MTSRLAAILNLVLFLVVSVSYQSCDSTLNIEKPDTFIKYIGTDGNQEGVDVVTDEAGNFYILGSTTSKSAGKQIYLVMTNGEGFVQWEQIYGDAGDEQPKDLEILDNGNLIIVADRVDGSTGEKDIVIYMTSMVDGALLTAPRVAGQTSIEDHVNSITQIPGGFVVCAYANMGTYKQGHVMRFSNDFQQYTEGGTGNGTGWTETISLRDGSSGYDIVPVKMVPFIPAGETSPTFFYTFGYTNNPPLPGGISEYNYFIYVGTIQLNDNVNVFFVPGPEETTNEILTSVKTAPNDLGAGFVLGGYVSESGSNQHDLYLLRIRQRLDKQSVPDPSNPGAYFYNVSGTENPRIVPSGLSASSVSRGNVFYSTVSQEFLVLGEENSQGNENILLTKLDGDFHDAWTGAQTARVFGGAGDDTAGAVIETVDGNILVCGTMTLGDVTGQKKIVLMKLNTDGMLSGD